MHCAPPYADDYVGDFVARAAIVGKSVLVVVAAASIAALLYYLWKGYIPEFHSDSAIKNLLAEEAVRSHTYFPPDWNYVNGDLWVLFGQIFIIPLLGFFRNGYELHAFSGTISSVIVLASVWLVSGMVLKSRWTRLLVVTILAGGVSSLMAENLFGQVSYGTVLYLAAFSLFFGWRWIESTSIAGRFGWGFAFLLLTILSFWGNPQRATAYDAAPMFVAIMTWALARSDFLVRKPGARFWRPSEATWRAAQLGMLLVVGAVVGALLHASSIASVNNTEGAGSARWLSFAGFLINAGKTGEGMFAIFGGIPPQGQLLISPAGLYYGLRFLAVGGLLAIMPVACVYFLRALPSSARMFAAFTASSLCLFVFLQVTTSTPDMIDPVTSSRYMLPALVFGLVMVVGYAEWKTVRSPTGLLAWAVVLVLLSSLISPNNPFGRIYRDYAPDPRLDLVHQLKARGLKYGYATYWNSGALSVLSQGDVLIRQIRVERNLPTPYRHLSSNRWYRDDAWKGSTFIMLKPEEASEVDWPRVYSYVGMPTKELELGGFLIKVFPSNLAEKMPGWDDRVAAPVNLLVPIDKYARHTAGTIGQGPSGHEITAQIGEAGFLHFGPYVDMPPGSYRVEFNVETTPSSQPGYVDVTSENGSRVLAKADIGHEPGNTIVLAFGSLQPMSGVEFRVFSNGSARVTLRRIDISREQKVLPDSGERKR